jgi:hypothetical protein
MRSKIDLAKDVAGLGDLSRDELSDRWSKAHGCAPPKGIRQDLLVRSAAWHLQVKRLGGLTAETRRLLRSAMVQVGEKNRQAHPATISTSGEVAVAAEPARPVPARKLLPGARLLRDWNGKTHVVEVIEDGFVFQSKLYKSLTAIARNITGAHWSGPRFFGL